MSNLSKIIELVESEFGPGKAQLISDLLSKPDFIPEGAEEVCETLEAVNRLTVARDRLVEELDGEYQIIADKLAGGFLSLGDAVAKVEVLKAQDDIDRAVEDALCEQVYCMDLLGE